MRSLDSDLLEQRKKKVLQMVIHQYISTAKPVGSKFIANSGGLDLSPATIRNVLSILEEEGYITHPHTSAGRVPTDKGYRYYVDSIIEIQRLARDEELRISRGYEKRTNELNNLMQQTTKILSSLSHYSGFVIAPSIKKDKFAHMELINTSNKRVLMVLVTESGRIKNKVILVDNEISQSNLNKISNMLNQKLNGLDFSQIKEEVLRKIDELESEKKELISLARIVSQQAFDLDDEGFYLEGAGNILDQPEFENFDQLKSIFNLVEEKKLLGHILEEELAQDKVKDHIKLSSYRKKGNIKIVIGEENTYKELKGLSLISSIYQHNDNNVGILGIIGPRRMEYSKMIALVDYISSVVNKIIGRSVDYGK
ncbi:MAG: heat-inducible transcriptional repressor HrcA [bacterium]